MKVAQGRGHLVDAHRLDALGDDAEAGELRLHEGPAVRTGGQVDVVDGNWVWHRLCLHGGLAGSWVHAYINRRRSSATGKRLLAGAPEFSGRTECGHHSQVMAPVPQTALQPALGTARIAEREDAAAFVEIAAAGAITSAGDLVELDGEGGDGLEIFAS